MLDDRSSALMPTDAVVAEDAPAASPAGASPARALAALAPALLLGACGDGGSTTTAAAPVAPGITVAAASVTPVQASRFLAQSTMGATRAMVDTVVARGFDGWLADQFALLRATTHRDCWSPTATTSPRTSTPRRGSTPPSGAS